jgi:hypothetical protein
MLLLVIASDGESQFHGLLGLHLRVECEGLPLNTRVESLHRLRGEVITVVDAPS